MLHAYAYPLPQFDDLGAVAELLLFMNFVQQYESDPTRLAVPPDYERLCRTVSQTILPQADIIHEPDLLQEAPNRAIVHTLQIPGYPETIFALCTAPRIMAGHFARHLLNAPRIDYQKGRRAYHVAKKGDITTFCLDDDILTERPAPLVEEDTPEVEIKTAKKIVKEL